MGVFAPEIVIPAWLLLRDTDAQRLAIQHELQHLRARDPLLIAAGWLCVVLVPWNPLAWYLLSRLRLAVELDCDSRLLLRGANARTYGALLLEVAQRSSALHTGVALANQLSHLETRLITMTAPKPEFRTLRTIALATSAVLLTAVACDLRTPTNTPAADNVPSASTAPPQVAADSAAWGGSRHLAVEGADSATMSAVLRDAKRELSLQPRVSIESEGWQTDSDGKWVRVFVGYNFRGPTKLGDRVATTVVEGASLPKGYKMEAKAQRRVVATRGN
jgi:hypothetical protein